MFCVCHAALCSPEGKRADLLALVCDVYCDFVTFPFGILGQGWYLIVSTPDFCCLSYFESRFVPNHEDRFCPVEVHINSLYFKLYLTQIVNYGPMEFACTLIYVCQHIKFWYLSQMQKQTLKSI